MKRPDGAHMTSGEMEERIRELEIRLHKIHELLTAYHDDPGSMSAKMDIVIDAMEKIVKLSAVEPKVND